MNSPEEARARLAEITERRKQALDGTTRGRHRGWDATGGIAMIAGFAALDLPAPTALRVCLLGVAAVVSLAAFTRAGQHAQVALHSSRLSGRFWALITGSGLVFGVLTYFGLRMLDLLDVPLRYTLVGVVLAAVLVVTHPLYRVLLRATA
jgi:hypothetical protein